MSVTAQRPGTDKHLHLRGSWLAVREVAPISDVNVSESANILVGKVVDGPPQLVGLEVAFDPRGAVHAVVENRRATFVREEHVVGVIAPGRPAWMRAPKP